MFFFLKKKFVLWPCAFGVSQNRVIYLHRQRVHNEHWDPDLPEQEQIPHGACLLYIVNPAWHFTQGDGPFISWMLAALFQSVVTG